MKKLLLLFGVGCVWLSGQSTQPKRETRPASRASLAQRPAIEGIAEDWRNASNAGDASKVASLYTEDAYYLSAHILAHGREAIKAYWKRGITAGGHIDFIKPLATFRRGNSATPPELTKPPMPEQPLMGESCSSSGRSKASG